MAKIEIYKIGKPAKSEYEVLAENFLKRLRPWKVTNTIVKNLSQLEKKQGDYWIFLEEKGRLCHSMKFFNHITELRTNRLYQRICFIVAGPYGFESKDHEKKDFSFSLSPLTYPSDLAWVVLTEQIYRAYTLSTGSDYHHE